MLGIKMGENGTLFYYEENVRASIDTLDSMTTNKYVMTYARDEYNEEDYLSIYRRGSNYPLACCTVWDLLMRESITSLPVDLESLLSDNRMGMEISLNADEAYAVSHFIVSNFIGNWAYDED